MWEGVGSTQHLHGTLTLQGRRLDARGGGNGKHVSGGYASRFGLNV